MQKRAENQKSPSDDANGSDLREQSVRTHWKTPHAYALDALLKFCQAPDDADKDRSRAQWFDRSHFLVLMPAGVTVGGRLGDLEVEALQRLKRGLRESLEWFLKAKTWRAPLDAPLVVDDLEVWDPASVPNLIATPGLRLEFRGRGLTSFWFTVGGIIVAAGEMLRRCPHCGVLFVRHGRSDYCSLGCSQRARSKDHYERHREAILEKRHTQYVKRQIQRQPKAKIQQRRRLRTKEVVK